MRKIKEVLRLRFELGLGQLEIFRACSLSQAAVHNYLKRAAETGMQWPLPGGWDEKRIEEAVRSKNPLGVPFLILQPSTNSSSIAI